ncbi:MAG: GAF and ANTAR domain-containing protein [Nocardioides sp.]
MVSRPDIANALAQAAREINAPRDIGATLDAIVETARGSLPGIDHVGITLAHRDGTMETVAATDQLVWDLDAVQYKFGEGPCVHAIETADVIVVENASQESRWPRFMAEAVQRGLRAQMGIRLYTDEKTLGGLNMYSLECDTFEPGTQELAELFATHAALALGRARIEDELTTALNTRGLIGQALGLLMARYHMDNERAFQYLVRVSSHSNMKLRDVAAEVVEQHLARIQPSED